MYQFWMTIGDWSGDGHGKSEDFLISSNVPVDRVREAHFRIKEAAGIDIEDICSSYGEDEVDAETVEILKRMGFLFENKSGMGERILSVEEMAKLWLFLLQKADDELELALIENDAPSLHFYGTDQQGRHIDSVGYGLFTGE